MRFNKVIDPDSRDLLGLAGAHIFTNLLHLYHGLNLLYVLHKVPNAPADSPSNSKVAAVASLVREAIMCLLTLYKRLGTGANPTLAPADSDKESDGSSSSDESG
jgi:hypothetical protein